MARLIYTEHALEDLERLVDFLVDADPASARPTLGLITGAVAMLAEHPLVGRPIDPTLRELVISRGSTGYVALYSFEREPDVVLVLAVRHQRETGYTDESEP